MHGNLKYSPFHRTLGCFINGLASRFDKNQGCLGHCVGVILPLLKGIIVAHETESGSANQYNGKGEFFLWLTCGVPQVSIAMWCWWFCNYLQISSPQNSGDCWAFGCFFFWPHHYSALSPHFSFCYFKNAYYTCISHIVYINPWFPSCVLELSSPQICSKLRYFHDFVD